MLDPIRNDMIGKKFVIKIPRKSAIMEMEKIKILQNPNWFLIRLSAM